jgi:hypothetical protein
VEGKSSAAIKLLANDLAGGKKTVELGDGVDPGAVLVQ